MVVDMKNCQESNGKTQADLFSWIKCVHGNDWPEEEQAPAATAVLAKVARVIRSKTAMQKNINKPGGQVPYDKFMNSKFELPSRRPHHRTHYLLMCPRKVLQLVLPQQMHTYLQVNMVRLMTQALKKAKSERQWKQE